MRQTQCPVCSLAPNAEEQELSLILCSRCGVTWTLILREVDTAALYADEVYAVVDNRDSAFEKIIMREAGSVLKQARRLLAPGANRLLDFGCGKGQFLYRAAQEGWVVSGVETAPERAEFARNCYGVAVQEGLYTDGKLDGEGYDLITLNHVLEHLPQPVALLDRLLVNNLADGGVVMLEVPRLDSWQSRLAGRRWMHLDFPKHLTHWTHDTLASKMNEIGYEVIGQRRFSVHLGVLGMLQALASRTGFNDNIIVALKHRRTLPLMARIAMLLPLAFALEVLAIPFGRTGILGFFLQKSPAKAQ
ncbi:class I SAM-dependent methyltransferase [Pseudohalioglobus lutimaris]|uniref:Class I SAM-dependent methyltransferase n=1 Tax=Pseudohalioglobus lutimaris TaxID=1737061 RepID=A0A2N5X7Q0_9GAMM|nr:class I SAM-dependent methyltransferase [Pseudohalioglobus lutimaris]PLW70498.1 class I SAM-dependent methyltransferase [Pseudohalioglobus lutimaris]